MQPACDLSRRQQLRAPDNHGELLCVPSIHSVRELLVLNQSRRLAINEALERHGLRHAAESARQETLAAAIEYTGSYRDLPASIGQGDLTIVMSGHQPELFHPGVWAKNFAISGMAQAAGGVALNMIVDNDVIGQPTVLVPNPNLITGGARGSEVIASPANPQQIIVAMDRATEIVPFEQREIVDPAYFAGFAQRCAEALGDIVSEPLIHQLWPHARKAVAAGANLGGALAQARHQLEAGWGLRTLEVPLSRICQTASFRHFCAHVLSHADSFSEAYNESILAYRQRHRLRSQSHPAPLLARDSHAWELPFWVWQTASPQRQPLLVQPTENGLALFAGSLSNAPTAELDADADWPAALQQLEWQAGIKVRPRALMTTLYCRMFLADLFVHGIGGGKYDEVTDRLIEAHFGCEAQEFLVVTATYRLPCSAGVPNEKDDVRQIDGLLRELWFHPDANLDFVEPDQISQFTQLVAKKRKLIANRPPRGQRKSWHEQLEMTNKSLRLLLDSHREMLLAERNRLIKLVQTDKILSSREYSFCLFTDKGLRSLLDLLSPEKF